MFPGRPGSHTSQRESERETIQMCDITSHFCLAGLALVYVWYDMHEFLPAYLKNTAKKDFKMGKKNLLAGREGWKTHICQWAFDWEPCIISRFTSQL